MLSRLIKPLRLAVEWQNSISIFLDAMVHRFMARKLFANRLVELRFIGHQRGFAGNVSAQDWHHLSNRSVVNVEAADRSAAPNNCRRMPCIASRSATPNASAMSCSPISGSGWSMENPCDKSFIRGAAAALAGPVAAIVVDIVRSGAVFMSRFL